MACPTFNPVGTSGQIENLQDDFFGRAEATYSVAEQYISQMSALFDSSLGSFSVQSTNSVIDAVSAGGESGDVPYETPEDPEYPELTFNNGVLTDKPWESTLGSIDIGPHSALTLSKLGVTFPSRSVAAPAYQPLTEPGFVVDPVGLITIGEIDYSDLDNFDKDFDAGPAPTLKVFDIPPAPDVAGDDIIARLAAWRALQPGYENNLDDLISADQDPEILVWNAIDRALALLKDCAPTVDAALISIDVSPIHARAVAREEIRLSREEAAIWAEYNARGWDAPDGFLVARIDEARRQASERILDVNREVVVQEITNEAENARALLSSQTQQLSAWLSAISGVIGSATAFLRLAELSYERAKILINSRLELLRFNLQAWETAGRGFDIEASVQKLILERYEAQLGGLKIASEINRDLVALYEARQKGVANRADAYRALAQGVAERVRAEISRLEENRYKLEKMAEQVKLRQAESSQYLGKLQTINGFFTQVQGNEANLYGSDHARYASVVGAMSQLKGTDATLSYREAELELEQARTEVQGQTAVIDGEARRVQALSSVYGALSQKFQADVQAAIGGADVTLRGRALAQDKTLRLRDQAVAEFDALERSRLQQEQIASNERIEKVRVGLAAMSAQSSVAGQLAAGAMSAFSLNTGLSLDYSVRQSYSCSESQ